MFSLVAYCSFGRNYWLPVFQEFNHLTYFIHGQELTCFTRARVIIVQLKQGDTCGEGESVPARVFSLSRNRSETFFFSLSLFLPSRLPRGLQVLILTYFEVGSSQGGTSEKTRKYHVNWNP